jgi:hypothetical protein
LLQVASEYVAWTPGALKTSSSQSFRLPKAKLRVSLIVLFLLGTAAGVLAEEDRFTAKAVEISLRGGQVKTVPIDLGSDPRQDLKLWARLEALPEGWPEKDLRIEIVSDEIDSGPRGRTLVVRVTAEHCCRAGEYDASLAIGADKPDLPQGNVAALPLRIRVEQGPVCANAKRTAGGLVLLAVLLWLYARGMYFNCCFLAPDHLAARLVPLRWTSQGQTEGASEKRDEVRAQVEAQFRPVRRFRAWLRANPLVFGLPWKGYRETVAMHLGRRPESVQLEFMPHRDTFEHCQANSEEARGKLFASATPSGGAFIFCVPDSGGLIGRLRPESTLEGVAKVKHGTKLITVSAHLADDPNPAAGWQILS